jgi:hypothetical protein
VRAATAGDTLARGVVKALWRKDGYEVLLAITSRGDCLRSVVLRPGVNEARAVRWLEQLLERCDPKEPPRPPLYLVAPTPSAPTRTQAELAAMYRDQDPIRARLAFRRRAIEAGGLPSI